MAAVVVQYSACQWASGATKLTLPIFMAHDDLLSSSDKHGADHRAHPRREQNTLMANTETRRARASE